MPSPADPIAAVSQQVDDFLREQADDIAGFGAEAASMADAARTAVAGGKRLRARFCLAGWQAAGGDDVPEALARVAGAVEVFHAAALVHDDLVDNSDTRRGLPSAHRRLQASHEVARWQGDAAAFGRSGALLVGDLLLGLSDDLLESGLAAAPPARAAAARAQYGRMRRDVMVGQFLDIAEESAFARTPGDEHASRALRVAMLKSARYSVEQPLLIGARLAGADAALCAGLAAFGRPVGMAFQLRDDVLGVFGDARVTGKPAGDDLREGKRTVLVAFTRQALAEAERPDWDRVVGDPTLRPEDIARAQRRIRDTGALDRCERLISEYAAEADAALARLPVPPAARERLRRLADAATVRRS